MRILDNLERVLDKKIQKILQFLPLSFLDKIGRTLFAPIKYLFFWIGRSILGLYNTLSHNTLHVRRSLTKESRKAKAKIKETLQKVRNQKEAQTLGRASTVLFYLKITAPILREGCLSVIDRIGLVKVLLSMAVPLLVALSFKIFLYYQKHSLYEEDISMENPRPSYYKQQEKAFYIRNISIPIYIQSVNSYKKLETDVIVISSNKYIKEYLDRQTHLVNNALNSGLEPVIPTFPLTEEGKLVITNKIKKELNNLIKSLKIKGEVQHVYLYYIFAG